MSKVIIFGSYRSFGNTRKIVDEIFGQTYQLIDLNAFTINSFDYENPNLNDDFIPLMEKIITYDSLIIATPVYWYSMSTQHKIFFDRFSDFFTTRKDLRYKLRGKKLFVIASFGSSYPRGFEDIFEQICEYLTMQYLGSCFVYTGTENAEFLNNNISQIEKLRLVLGIKTNSGATQ